MGVALIERASHSGGAVAARGLGVDGWERPDEGDRLARFLGVGAFAAPRAFLTRASRPPRDATSPADNGRHCPSRDGGGVAGSPASARLRADKASGDSRVAGAGAGVRRGTRRAVRRSAVRGSIHRGPEAPCLRDARRRDGAPSETTRVGVTRAKTLDFDTPDTVPAAHRARAHADACGSTRVPRLGAWRRPDTGYSGRIRPSVRRVRSRVRQLAPPGAPPRDAQVRDAARVFDVRPALLHPRRARRAPRVPSRARLVVRLVVRLVIPPAAPYRVALQEDGDAWFLCATCGRRFLDATAFVKHKMAHGRAEREEATTRRWGKCIAEDLVSAEGRQMIIDVVTSARTPSDDAPSSASARRRRDAVHREGTEGTAARCRRDMGDAGVPRLHRAQRRRSSRRRTATRASPPTSSRTAPPGDDPRVSEDGFAPRPSVSGYGSRAWIQSVAKQGTRLDGRADEAMYRNLIVHELIHALGFSSIPFSNARDATKAERKGLSRARR